MQFPTTPDDEAALTADIIELARKYGRYGYRRITALLRRAAAVGSRLPGLPGDLTKLFIDAKRTSGLPAPIQGYSLHHSGHLTMRGVRVAFTMVR